jgi:hypothetical protein
MTADHHWKRTGALFGGDDQSVADSRPQPAGGRFGHSACGFADCETDAVRTWFKGPNDLIAVERALHEHAGIDGTNAGPDDGQQI